jgi:preprotein translocase subunit
MEKLQSLLKPGSKVILLGGIYGRVIKMSEDTAIVNIAKDVDIKVDRSAIKEVVA